jgi:hypothetical protein
MSNMLMYDTDSGVRRDLGKEMSLSRTTEWNTVLTVAKALADEYGTNYALIILTSPYGSKPGAYYIKGYAGEVPYDTIKARLEANAAEGLYGRRQAWLVVF